MIEQIWRRFDVLIVIRWPSREAQKMESELIAINEVSFPAERHKSDTDSSPLILFIHISVYSYLE